MRSAATSPVVTASHSMTVSNGALAAQWLELGPVTRTSSRCAMNVARFSSRCQKSNTSCGGLLTVVVEVNSMGSGLPSVRFSRRLFRGRRGDDDGSGFGETLPRASHLRSRASAIGRTTDCRYPLVGTSVERSGQGRPRTVIMGAPLPEKWNPENEPARVGAGSVTLVEGSSFCICTPAGDLGSAGPNGVFFRDTRILSRWDLRVDGELPDPLTAMIPAPYRGTFLGRLSRRFGRTDTNLLVQRERRIGNGLREDLMLRNPGAEPTTCSVTVALEADFADLFEVKEGRVQPRGERRARAQDDRLYLDLHW